MAIPKQVEEAASLAEQYIGSLNADPDIDEQEEESENEVNEETEEASKDTDTDEEEPEVKETEEDKTEEDKDTDVSKLLAEIEKKEQQYKSLQGKYNAEVPRLQNELKEMKDEIFTRIGEIADSKIEDAKKEDTNEMLDKFKEEYGDEYYAMLKEIIKNEVSPLLQDSIKPVSDKVTEVSESQEQTAQKEFAAALDQKVNGDWRNALEGKDDGFLEFLQQPDPSGVYTNAELFDIFNSKWQPEKMASLMNVYFGEPESEIAEKQKQHKQSPDEEALIAPSRKTKHKTPSSSENKIWTMQSIEEFQLADRQGKFSQEESKAMWDELLLALAENRIQ